MKATRRDLLIALTLAALAAAALLAATARADLGIVGASRDAGRPGEAVRLTVGCGFCFPPCVGPKGERRPEGFERGPCMLGSDRPPPASFGVYLTSDRHRGYRFLGRAVPPPGGNDPEAGEVPRYLLGFAIPELPPGDYDYAIRCGECGGALARRPATFAGLRIRAPGR